MKKNYKSSTLSQYCCRSTKSLNLKPKWIDSNNRSFSSIDDLKNYKKFCTLVLPFLFSFFYTQMTNAQCTLVPSITSVNNKCAGQSLGSADLTVTGNLGALSYQWSNAAVTEDISGLATSTYTVTITDAGEGGCQETAMVTIFEPAVLSGSISSSTNVTCFGGNNGSATVLPSGGTGVYAYTWSSTPNQFAATASNLIAGSYNVTIKDDNLCEVVVPVTITEPTQIMGNGVLTHVKCFGGSDGVIDLTATTGGSGAGYAYTGGLTAASTTGLIAGDYSVTITDNTPCSVTETYTITEPTELTLAMSSNNGCNNANNGTATVTPDGGTTPYSYAWSGGATPTAATNTGLAPGMYTVTVTDANLCVKTASVTITNPPALVNTPTQINVNCFGESTGMAITDVIGTGTAPYTYAWPIGVTNTPAEAENLAAGTYEVTITDANGCIITTSYTITEPASAIVIDYIILTPVKCKGGSDGIATIGVSGGTEGTGYTYSWDGGAFGPTVTISTFSAGSHSVIAKDSKGCTVTQSFTITEPALLTATIAKTDITCFGADDGTATATVAGGTGAVTYAWSDGLSQTTNPATGLIAGPYTVTVTDANLCTASASTLTDIIEPALLTATIAKTDITCFGADDGTATATVAGGTGAVTYAWSDGLSQTTNPATGLIAGPYTVTVTDANLCTASASTLTDIIEPALLTATIAKTDITCFGADDGTATATVAGGTGAVTYAWSDGLSQTTNPATGLIAGPYTVTVTDANLCTASASTLTDIIEPALLTATIAKTDITCFGADDGTATATVAGGTGAVTYAWSDGLSQTTNPATGLIAGPYTVTVTDANLCTASASTLTDIIEPALLTATIAKTDITCFGADDGTATATVAGGTGAVTYAWSDGLSQTTNPATGLIAGPYTVTVTDANLCTASASTLTDIIEPALLTATIAKTDITCFGADDGTATATVAGGTGAVTYAWSDGLSQTTNPATGLIAGPYTVTVTDANLCTASASTLTDIIEPALLTATIAKTDITCFGADDGTATATVAGGTGAVTYAWSDGLSQTTNPATGLIAGPYTVTVTDANLCTASASTLTDIIEPALLTATIAKTDITCFGADDGTATATVAGGTGAVTYAWSDGLSQTTNPATGLIAGPYTVTVTDANLCTASASTLTDIIEPALLTATIAKTDITCFGADDGTATATVAGGTGAVTYAWSDGLSQTTNPATGLIAGPYTVTVTDANLCTASASTLTDIIEPALLTATIAKTDITCFGADDGTATATVAGGTGAVTYAWSDGLSQTTNPATGLIAGPYTVTVTDANLCTASASTLTDIIEPALLTATIAKTDITCFGADDGTATATVAGGTGAVTYAWSDGLSQTTNPATGLIAGPYTVTVTDANLCTASASTLTDIIEPALLTATIAKTDITCFGADDGTATATVAGGTGAVTYAWSDGLSQTTNPATGLIAGPYTVTVTDANLCTASASTLTDIIEPALLTATIAKTDITCFGADDGTATATVAGGTGAVTYAWSDGLSQTTNPATGLIAGPYTVTVTDANLCTASASTLTDIIEPALLTASITKTDILCAGQTNGTATVTAAGGTGAYSYIWTDASTLDNISGLSTGTYSVTVKDANNCSVVKMASIFEPATLNISNRIINNVTCNGGNNGSITVIPIGGGSPLYMYSWASGQSSATILSQLAGDYMVTVTDANGCTTDATITITEPTAIANTFTINNGCNGSSIGTALSSPTGGTAPYTYVWSNAQTAATATGLSQASSPYNLTITDSKGCTLTDNVSIVEPSAITNAFSSTPVSCLNGTDGTATVTPSGGTAPYTYAWPVSAASQTATTATGLAVGSYMVTVTDANGCTATQSVDVTQIATLTVSIAKTDVKCNGGTDGTATATAAGGTGAVTYAWNDGASQTAATAIGLNDETYSVIVTDTKGCTATASTTISEPMLALSGMVTKTDVKCNGGADGTATVTTTGGTGAVTYAWSGGTTQTASTTEGLTIGSYTVTLTDANGCIATASTTADIAEPALALSGTVTKTDVKCKGGADGTATVTTTGGTGAVTYAWSGGATPTAPTTTGLAIGSYTVTLTDANGCTATASTPTAISEPALALSGTVATIDVKCKGVNDGTATVTAAGGTQFTVGNKYTYLWSVGQTTNPATGLGIGAYTVTITDANGCIATVSTTADIAEPALALTVSIAKTDVKCNGGTDGTATATAAGGTGIVTYAWTGGQTANPAIGLNDETYSVIVTDTKGCTATASTTISEPMLALSGTVTKTDVKCKGGADGTATVTVVGGTGAVTYLWTGGQTAATATGLAIGSYTVTLTDANLCTATASTPTAISEPALALSGTVTKTDVKCKGVNDGTATVTTTGGTGAVTYAWPVSAGSQTTATATGLAIGSYTVTLTDANLCTATASTPTAISEPALALSGMVATTDVKCKGVNDGTATVTVVGGTGAVTYLWTGGKTTNPATGLGIGAYTVTITDANGCIATASTTADIAEPALALSVTVAKTDVKCNGGTDGTATATTTGGTGIVTYAWTGGQTAATAIGLNDETYSVIVTDANGCTATASTTISEPMLALSGTVTKTDVKCKGGADGTATVTTTGGTGAVTYAWSGGTTPSAATTAGLAAGSYTVTLTDANLCTATASTPTAISEPALALSGTVTKTDVKCKGGADGTATVTTTGGTGAVTYAWTGGQTAATATGLAIGSYTVTLTDANLCTATASTPTAISEPALALSGMVATTDVKCKGVNDGTATVTVVGGTGAVTYLWTGGKTTNPATGLGIGAYTVTITDANGCIATASTTADIAEPAVALSVTVAKTDVKCNGGTDGTATATAAGGTGAVTYAWTGGQTSNPAIGLNDETYSVIVTDTKGCTATASTTISEPMLALSGTVTKTDVKCKGGADGTATVTTTGGTGAVTYAWSGGTTPSASTTEGLAIGSYTVTLTDANLCTATASTPTAISEPALALSGMVTKTDVKCKGVNDGTATVTTTGGTGAVTYAWSGGATPTAPTTTGLAIGSYTVTLTDANLCTATASTPTAISEPALALTVTVAKTDVKCNGGTDGTATATAVGGTGAVTYLWNDGASQTAATAIGLNDETYSVIVTDANGCTATASTTISEPMLALSGTVTKTDVKCKGVNDGTATVTTTGGTGAVTYLWSGGSAPTAATTAGLAAGSYTVTLTDANGCTATASTPTAIAEPALALSGTVTKTDVTCKGGTDGTATVIPIGGTGVVSFLWSDAGSQTTNKVIDLVAGTYTVTLTDANGCTATASTPTAISEPATGMTASVVKTDIKCKGMTNGTATVTVTDGTPGYTYLWSNGQSGVMASNLSIGNYSVVVTDNSGCTISASTPSAIVEPADILDATISKSDVICKGGNDGSATVNATGGTGAYTYVWNTNPVQTTQAAILLKAGSYTVTVGDANGCTTILNTFINESSSSTINSTIFSTNIKCNGGNNGSATVNVTEGLSPFTYLWSNGSEDNSISNLLKGTYTVTVTDANACTSSHSVEIEEPKQLVAEMYSSTFVGCLTCCDGTSYISTQGGTLPYKYKWSNGQTTATASGLCISKQYTVVVTDANGCTLYDTVVYAAPSGISNTGNGVRELSVYPNPATDYFNLTGATQSPTDLDLNITNVKGQSIFRKNILVDGEFSERIDSESLSSGIYFIEVKTSFGVEKLKLIIK